jgi:hypothetical protein
MRVALFLFIIAGFERWIDGCQARKFNYFSASDLNGIRSALSCWDRGVVADGPGSWASTELNEMTTTRLDRLRAAAGNPDAP